MKIKKRATAAFCAAIMALTVLPSARAYSGESGLRAADTLYTLGLIEGTEQGYELNRTPTRAEAMIFAVRLLGGEDEVGGDYHNPFKDVPDWARDYAAYAYCIGLVEGRAEGRFEPNAPVSERDFATMLLRVMGYVDAKGDFSWASSNDFAQRLGIKRVNTGEVFSRADMFAMARDALTAKTKRGETLADRLIREGDVERAKANAVGLPYARALSGDEIYSKCIDSVFLITVYENERALQMNEPGGNASGFFVTSDGVAVSNYHAFENNTVAVVTLNNGEKYRVTDMLSFDKGSDLVVFRVSRTTMDRNKFTSAFPCLEYIGADNVKNGETVYAIGNPLVLQGSISVGIVSYNGRKVEGFSLPMIQNTAPISQGNSGGVLVNAYGQAVGSTCAYFIYGQNLNLAIPLDILFELDFDAEGCSIAEMHKIVNPEAELNEAAAEEQADGENSEE